MAKYGTSCLLVLELVLNDLPDEKPKIFDTDPMFIAARGAAELAKQILVQGWRTRMLEHEINIQFQDIAGHDVEL